MPLPTPHVTRREVVGAAAATGLLAAVPDVWARGLLRKRPRIGPGDFLDGVASGEPSADGVTFWSRLTTDHARSGARLLVATDPGMRKVVASAVVPTGRGVNGTLKTRIGGLKPATEYHYAWESGTGVSPVGRTRTAPPPDSAVPLSIAFSSCQQFSVGYFSAHTHAAATPLDAYLMVGDYIYERGRTELREDTYDANDLASFRAKYRQYRTDVGLRELHRLHPIIHVWDDHEVQNDYTEANPYPAPALLSAGYRASFEWLPRMAYPSERNRIYKKFSFGRFADVFMLDSRQYRISDGPEDRRSMLGAAQYAWLVSELRASRARWKLVGNQDLVAAGVAGADGPGKDAWNGYPGERARLLAILEREGIDDVVFLTGDAHVFVTSLLASNFTSFGDGSSRKAAAVEYLGGSVTSPGRDVPESSVRANAPWVQQYNGVEHGYAHLDVRGDALVTEYRASDTGDPAGATRPFERFTQLPGRNRMSREIIAPPARRV